MGFFPEFLIVISLSQEQFFTYCFFFLGNDPDDIKMLWAEVEKLKKRMDKLEKWSEPYLQPNDDHFDAQLAAMGLMVRDMPGDG